MHLLVHAVLTILLHCFGIAHPAEGGGDELVVLGGYHYCVHAHGLAGGTVIFDGVLRFAVGAQIGHHFGAVLADVGEDAQRQVRQGQGEGHIFGCVPAGISEHHSLVAGALLFGVFTHHAAADVPALLVNGGEHSAGVAVEHIIGFVIADCVDHAAHCLLDVHIGVVGADFAAYDHEACAAEGFAGHLRRGILAEEFIEDCV